MSKKIRTIGYDLNHDFCQISYGGNPEEEPETLYLMDEKEGTELPLIIARRDNSSEWITGMEARRIDAISNGVVVRDLLRKALNKETISVGEERVSVISLLTMFIEQSMQRIYLPNLQEYETYLIFTVPEISEDVITLLKSIAAKLGFSGRQVFVQDYKESFYDFMIHQSRELWNYDVAMFDFEGGTLYGYRMDKEALVKGRRSELLTVKKQAYPDANGAPVDDDHFLQCAQQLFSKKLLSSVYLIGQQFEEDWYPKTLRYICNGRRAFRGRNLFSKGACYGGFRKAGIVRPETVYLDSYKVVSQISLRLKVNGKEQWYPLVYQGENWYEINRSIEILLDQTTELKIRVDSIGSTMPREESIRLEGLFETQRRTVRLYVEVVFLASNRCRIRIRDIDFGEIRKAAGYEFTYNLQIEQPVFH